MALLRNLYYKLTPGQRLFARRLVYFPIDLFRKRSDMEPPKGKIFVGSGDFISHGKNTLELFKQHGGLLPDHNVLDIGSGIGRMAVPLTSYLDKTSRYEGFDIVKDGVDWCKKNITSKFSNFNFTHVDLKNDLYNLNTEKKASSYIFPYQNDSFNFVFLTSVFTHMMPDDMDHYLSEINRVLKNNGTCFATFFIYDQNSPEKYTNKGITFTFEKEKDFSLYNTNVKEANICFKKEYLYNTIRKKKFSVENFIQGWWIDGIKKESATDYQDILILKKKNSL
ncbi:class I SAM-dependent methyltransferase [Aquimarina sp. BL5]|uniref:class I SAM-dependent methyltransferase n=1 Tax=Aquimarina sp. BL5 TaxID=1714860 RepID=UPI000E4899F8|nr:class I SAM-dependent methyltransferase [Aquimarina sp. BL5]AXT50899.1 class I SAM-dependent methyltransferase [Aquimarina sp. BL5]RKN05597.1 methyltransferase domain-containing protein [Aquimarina sp. BL5]